MRGMKVVLMCETLVAAVVAVRGEPSRREKRVNLGEPDELLPGVDRAGCRQMKAMNG